MKQQFVRGGISIHINTVRIGHGGILPKASQATAIHV